ncbi:hypothetical protein COU15_02600 [Candidatus Kaiserbacteria bacterium CG10_big_fil_rev_8_21_14_0_10_45_20]|uniref:Uncharacterized protein n=1 Tax=Candidatus Kaiserbacteria bacterium CG10_big_fil_rev_8_21_14_0_10_45_20 TaxID=1974607 RepID=A0A2H0UFI0_9BACT|nr:MAG: hypothetical protein COU15_02600 [Candidatus Kaiserbacteria bacterium CG10_big_fil_rev_8_21_14_0_10_45_20]
MKNFFREYFAYIKDNPKHYWFKRKLYGWGWTPATWEGWLVTAVFIVAIVWNATYLSGDEIVSSDTVTNAVMRVLALTVLFILIAWKKGEPPKWMWGIPKRKDKGSASESDTND